MMLTFCIDTSLCITWLYPSFESKEEKALAMIGGGIREGDNPKKMILGAFLREPKIYRPSPKGCYSDFTSLVRVTGLVKTGLVRVT